MEGYWIYKHFNKEGDCIYVGLTINMLFRQRDHLSTSPHKDEIHKIEYCDALNQKTMENLEVYFINRLMPKYNIKDKNGDDMSWMDDVIHKFKFKEYKKSKNKVKNIQNIILKKEKLKLKLEKDKIRKEKLDEEIRQRDLLLTKKINLFFNMLEENIKDLKLVKTKDGSLLLILKNKQYKDDFLLKYEFDGEYINELYTLFNPFGIRSSRYNYKYIAYEINYFFKKERFSKDIKDFVLDKFHKIGFNINEELKNLIEYQNKYKEISSKIRKEKESILVNFIENKLGEESYLHSWIKISDLKEYSFYEIIEYEENEIVISLYKENFDDSTHIKLHVQTIEKINLATKCLDYAELKYGLRYNYEV